MRWEDRPKEKWVKGEPGGPAGPFWSVVSSSGRLIALALPDEKIADLLVYSKKLADYDFDTIQKISRKVREIFKDEFVKEEQYPIDSGAYDYVVRTIIRAIFEDKLE